MIVEMLMMKDWRLMLVQLHSYEHDNIDICEKQWVVSMIHLEEHLEFQVKDLVLMEFVYNQ